MRFTVDGNPIPKQSYRAVKGGGYQPKRVTDWQEHVGWCARTAMGSKDLILGDLKVTLRFTRDNKRRVDADNLSKAVLDGMNAIVYADDKQIKELHLFVEYDGEPGVDVEVEQL